MLSGSERQFYLSVWYLETFPYYRSFILFEVLKCTFGLYFTVTDSYCVYDRVTADQHPCYFRIPTSEFFRDEAFDNLLPINFQGSFSAAASALNCAALCQNLDWCNSFFYNDVSRQCSAQRMVYKASKPEPDNIAYGWKYFRLTSGENISRADLLVVYLIHSSTKAYSNTESNNPGIQLIKEFEG